MNGTPLDLAPPVAQRANYAVHAVHHPPVGTQNDGMRWIDFVDELRVFQDCATGRTLVLVVEPVDLVDFPNLRERHSATWEVAREPDQPVDVPRHQPSVGRPEVILLAHARAVSGSAAAETRPVDGHVIGERQKAWDGSALEALLS